MEICRSIRCAHAITKAQLHDALVNVSPWLHAQAPRLNNSTLGRCAAFACRGGWAVLTASSLRLPPPQHGQGLGDKFSVDYILAAAKKAVGGTPASGVDEVAWLQAFLKARHTMLYNWDKVARASVKRITMYEKLVDLGE